MYFTLSQEFGWLPADITRLTVSQANGYLKQISEFYKDIAPPAYNLAAIRKALFGWFGIKETDSEETMKEARSAGIKTATITAEEKDAWIEAGMPNLEQFLKEYRNAD